MNAWMALIIIASMLTSRSRSKPGDGRYDVSRENLERPDLVHGGNIEDGMLHADACQLPALLNHILGGSAFSSATETSLVSPGC